MNLLNAKKMDKINLSRNTWDTYIEVLKQVSNVIELKAEEEFKKYENDNIIFFLWRSCIYGSEFLKCILEFIRKNPNFFQQIIIVNIDIPDMHTTFFNVLNTNYNAFKRLFIPYGAIPYMYYKDGKKLINGFGGRMYILEDFIYKVYKYKIKQH